MLAYRLVAHGIGGRTVRELNDGPEATKGEGMDSDEFLTWAAFVQLEPLPEQRMDALTAMMMAQQYNMNRGKKAPKKPTAFLARWYKAPKQPMTLEQMGKVMRMQVIRMGGSLEGIDD
jgi:hypothetical protein